MDYSLKCDLRKYAKTEKLEKGARTMQIYRKVFDMYAHVSPYNVCLGGGSISVSQTSLGF